MRILHIEGLSTSGNVTSLSFRFEGKDDLFTVYGREAWALDKLMLAGEDGCTPINNPAPRWSHYVWLLRGNGVNVETVREEHGGTYSGTHARYVLRAKLARMKTTFYGENVQTAKSLSRQRQAVSA